MAQETMILEAVMADIKKSDCVTLAGATEELRIARGTLTAYMSVLNVQRHKFPLDKRLYIAKVDLERIRSLLSENRS